MKRKRRVKGHRQAGRKQNKSRKRLRKENLQHKYGKGSHR